VHPLISVNYYAFIATLFSGLVLLLPLFPSVTFRLPSGLREWGLLIGLGIFGFFLQFLMTSGLVKDKSSRATNMMYSSVVFGLGVDFAIWGAVPGALSWVGGAVVTTATVWGSMQKAETGGRRVDAGGNEEYAMVPGDEILVSDDEDDEEEEDRPGNEVCNELQKYMA
jgi:drug/metabolite transporter (DMT)-like permease